MIAQFWVTVHRVMGTSLDLELNRKRVSGDRLGRVAMFALPLYLVPALLAVLIVGGLGLLLLAIASSFGGSANGAGPLAGAFRRPSRIRLVRAVAV
jgi:hypothetical protein